MKARAHFALLVQAVFVAGICEFLGALLVSHGTDFLFDHHDDPHVSYELVLKPLVLTRSLVDVCSWALP